MQKKYLVLIILILMMMSFSIINLKIYLPTVAYNYANIAFPSDVTNNLADMDNTPLDNPITDDGATLGRVLFYDVDLSRDHSISCASCHKQQFSFSDTARFSKGINGQRTARNSMGLIHARFQRDGQFFWDNRAASLEIQTLIPIQSNVEMGISLDTMVSRISNKPYYNQLFLNAFGTAEINSNLVSKALAQFIRSMNTFGSKFRQGVNITNGNPSIVAFSNFTAQENLGKNLFMDITRGNCQACHTRNVMVQQGAQNIGLDLVYVDNGVGAASGNSRKNGQFSVPSLINIELTPPYMHDGRFKTLEEVIDFYSDSIKPHPNLSGFLKEIIPGTINPNNNPCDTCPPRKPHYSSTEKAALVAFLKTFTDNEITTDTRWSNPFVCGSHNVTTLSNCESYTWNGKNYTNSGNYFYSYINSNGCVSTDTLKLTINKGTHNVSNITSCESYFWNGNTYTNSGKYHFNYFNSNGCASADTLNLTIVKGNFTSSIVHSCDSFTWHGNIYRIGGSYLYRYNNAAGCSSVDTLHLIIDNTHSAQTITSCNSYNWHNNTYTSSGIYTFSYTNLQGCSSIDTLNLTINYPSISTTTANVCTSALPYAWNGNIYSSSGTYYKTITNSNGCDSTATLILNTSTSIPASVATLSQTLVNNTCFNRIYRYTVSPIANAVGYRWILPNSLGNITGISVDSGDINSSRIIKLKYYSNTASIATDSIKVIAFSGCGSSLTKSFKLSNLQLSSPIAPTSITVTNVSPYSCNSRLYRYSAPNLPIATTSNTSGTGYLWSFTGLLGSNATIDSGNINSKTIIVKYTNNAASGIGDSVRVLFTSDCGNSSNRSIKLTNTLLNPPLAPSAITASLVSNACGARVYRYSAPNLTSGSISNGAATNYLWSFTGLLGSNAIIDSGNINSKTIKVRFTSNAASGIGDSVRVLYTSSCGNSSNRSLKLTNLLLGPPTAPATITTSLISDVCGARVYRYSAPILPLATTNNVAANGYLWSMPYGTVGSTGSIDSGNLNGRTIRIVYTSNASATFGDTSKIGVSYNSNCGNSLPKISILTNVLKSPPIAPTSITQTLVTDVCGARIYRYVAANSIGADGYLWTIPTSLGGIIGVSVDSGNVNADKIIKLKYISNSAAAATDSIKVSSYSGCGSSAIKSFKLTNLTKTDCIILNRGLPTTYRKRKEKRNFYKMFQEKFYSNTFIKK